MDPLSSVTTSHVLVKVLLSTPPSWPPASYCLTADAVGDGARAVSGSASPAVTRTRRCAPLHVSSRPCSVPHPLVRRGSKPPHLFVGALQVLILQGQCSPSLSSHLRRTRPFHAASTGMVSFEEGAVIRKAKEVDSGAQCQVHPPLKKKKQCVACSFARSVMAA